MRAGPRGPVVFLEHKLPAATGRVLAVDEDYVPGGLSGEIAAVLAEERTGAAFARVAVTDTLPSGSAAGR